MTAFRSLAGDLTWVGSGELPAQAACIGSMMQQKIPHHQVKHLENPNTMLKEMKQLRMVIMFRRPRDLIYAPEVTSSSDTAFKISTHQQYGQTGIISGIRHRTECGDAKTYHLID